MGCKLEFEGLQKLIEDLYKKGYAVEQGRSKALNAGANFVLAAMKESAPKRTGKLLKSLKKGNLSKKGIGVGSYGYPIAWYVEYGHAGPHGSNNRTPAHPYIEPAWESSKGEANAIIAETIKKAMGV